MKNERITENIVRDTLREKDYFDDDNDIVIEEQKSQIKRVQSLLKTASKSCTGKDGYPEFIINWQIDTNFLIVIECKASVKHHVSSNLDKPVDYAVDGVLHYAKFLSKDFTVLAVAVSGMNESELKVSNYLYPCGSDSYKVLTNESGMVVDSILSFQDYYRLSSFDPEVEKKRHQDLISFSKKLHELIWTAANFGRG